MGDRSLLSPCAPSFVRFYVGWPVPRWFSGFRKNAIKITRFLVVFVVVAAVPPLAGTGEMRPAGTGLLTLRITTIKGSRSRGVVLAINKTSTLASFT